MITTLSPTNTPSVNNVDDIFGIIILVLVLLFFICVICNDKTGDQKIIYDCLDCIKYIIQYIIQCIYSIKNKSKKITPIIIYNIPMILPK